MGYAIIFIIILTATSCSQNENPVGRSSKLGDMLGDSKRVLLTEIEKMTAI